MQKRAVAISDISCASRCSLTVALPIMSAAGIETAIIPTAVLSTQTDGIENYTFLDLTDNIMPVAKHWESLGMKFDAIYSGYLGSASQLRIVEEIIDMFGGDDTKVFVDPVMGDNGYMYSNFDGEYPKGMAKLCGKADIIVPNLTEAALLLGRECILSGYDRAYIESLLKDLAELGAKNVVISGVSLKPGKIGAAGYDREKGEISFSFTDHIDGFYPGTGDVFSSSLAAAVINGKALGEAMDIAVTYTFNSIKKTNLAGTDRRFGVEFETGLCEFGSNFK